MAEQRLYRTEAIVLRHARAGEAGRVLTLLTPGHGKLRAVVKGVLRPTSHLAGHVDLFARTRLLLAHARGLDIVTQAHVVDSHPGLRDDLDRAAAAAYAAELADRLTEEGHETPELYDLLCYVLGWLSAGQEPGLALRYLEVRALAVSGYQPELARCQACRRPLEPVLNAFSASAGGALCAGCAGGFSDARPMSVNALKVLRLLAEGDPGQLQRLRLQPSLGRELETLLRPYVLYVTEQQIRSLAFLETVREGSAARGTARQPAEHA